MSGAESPGPLASRGQASLPHSTPPPPLWGWDTTPPGAGGTGPPLSSPIPVSTPQTPALLQASVCQWRKLGDLITHRQPKHKLPRELPGEGAPGRRGQRAECGGRAGTEGPGGGRSRWPHPALGAQELRLRPKVGGVGGGNPDSEKGLQNAGAQETRGGNSQVPQTQKDWLSASRALRDLTLPFLIH